MGACSSKPKTAEFEGSTEPSKKTEDVSADRSIDAVDAAQVSQQNELGKKDEGAADAGSEAVQETRELIASGKKDEGAADAGAEAVQETHELIASKDEEPLIKELSSTAEGVSYSVKSEVSAGDGEAGHSAAEKGKADVGEAQKVDAGDSVANNKEISSSVTTVDDGVGGDQDKLFEDKAVVLDEASNGVVGMGDAYVDKGVAADEEKAHENSDKGSGSVVIPDEESRNLQDIKEANGIESPIIGVVQFAEPIHVDDVSEIVGSATPETTAHVDSKVSDSLDEIERDLSTVTNIEEDGIPPVEGAANLSSVSPQEAPEEKEKVLHDDSKRGPLLVSVADDGVGQKSGADDARGEEVPLASADAQGELSVEDTTKPETIKDPQNDIEKSTSEPQEERSLEESAREPHAEVTENEGNAGVLDEPEPEAPKVNEGIDTEISVEPKAETTLDQAIEGQGEGIVDEPHASDVQPQTLAIERQGDGIVDEPNARDVQPQALAVEETFENGKPDATPDEAIAEPSAETDKEEKVEVPLIKEATTKEVKVESVDSGNLETSVEQANKTSGEGDLTFEDASDVPLKVESSTIEAGNTPKS